MIVERDVGDVTASKVSYFGSSRVRRGIVSSSRVIPTGNSIVAQPSGLQGFFRRRLVTDD
jgi:hypothetical protein